MNINDSVSSAVLASLITASTVVLGATPTKNLDSVDANYPASFGQILRQGDFDVSQDLAPLTAEQVRQKLAMATDYFNYRSEQIISSRQDCVNRLLDQHKVQVGPNQVEFRARVDLSSCAPTDPNVQIQQDVLDFQLIMACSDGNFSALQGLGIHQAYQLVNSDETFCTQGTIGWRMGRSETHRQYTQQTAIGTIEVQAQTLIVDSMPDGKPCKTQQDQQFVHYQNGCQTFSKTSFPRATLNSVPVEKQGQQDLAVRVSRGIRALKGRHPWFEGGQFEITLNNQWHGSVVYSGAETPPQFELQSPERQSVTGIVGELATKQ